jgi:hypothetical protein
LTPRQTGRLTVGHNLISTSTSYTLNNTSVGSAVLYAVRGVIKECRRLVLAAYSYKYKQHFRDRLCGLVVRVLGYRTGGPGSIPVTTRKNVVGLERGALSLVSTN